jgi:hypothetical protein
MAVAMRRPELTRRVRMACTAQAMDKLEEAKRAYEDSMMEDRGARAVPHASPAVPLVGRERRDRAAVAVAALASGGSLGQRFALSRAELLAR